MLKYVVIILDRTSESFCHAENPYSERELIPLQTLKDAIFWAMKENLMIQFVYPDYQLPKEYIDTIDSIDHVDIGRSSACDVIVYDGFNDINSIDGKNIVIRTSLIELIDNKTKLVDILKHVARVSINLTNIDTLKDNDFKIYATFLNEIAKNIEAISKSGSLPQLNIITDRLLLDKMNNCNAGNESITIAPNGKFYICPAFYYDNEADDVGDIVNGLNIKNPQLYKLSYAPICRNCDAYQCHRCVWLNRKTTLEVNTPSHEQCVVAHLERNASRLIAPERIKEIDYVDPFDNIEK